MSGVSNYVTGYPTFSEGGIALATSHSGRLRENPDGSCEVIPKSPAFVFGEKVLRPMIDKVYNFSLYAFQWMKSGCSALDSLLTRVVNFLPMARAAEISQKSAYERCLEQPVNALVDVASAAVQKNNPGLIDAVNAATSRLVENCIEEQLYDQIQKQNLKEEELHNKKVKELNDAIHRCKQENPGYDCYKSLDHSQVPKLKRVRKTDQGGKAYYEWKAIQGFLCWEVSIDGWLYNKFHSNGGYNCDVIRNRPTIKDEKEEL